MTALVWDAPEDRVFETGVDHGVLYMPNESGQYTTGVAWNGLTSVTESPSGAEPSKVYADNILYGTLFSAEEFAATVEAFTCPDEFWEFDGVATTAAGVQIGQQNRPAFGFSFRTNKGNALNANAGYVLHLVYGCQAAPSEKAYSTINDSPEMTPFSWSLSTTPVAVTDHKPTAIVKIDSTDPRVDSARLAALELVLYGSEGVDPRLPQPDEVVSIMESGVSLVTPTAPTYNSTTDVITIPSITGVQYSIDGVGDVEPGDTDPITDDTVVRARPEPGYNFTGTYVTEWLIVFA
jgi:hypothetical protein